MKKSHPGLVCVAAMSACVSIAGAQVKDGFLEFPWGSELARVQQTLTLHGVGGVDVQHMFAADLARLGDIELDDCLLEFTAGRLSGVIITTQGHGNSRRLLALLKHEYGDGKRDSPLGYQWFSPRTHVAYDEDSAGDAYVYWYALPQAQNEPPPPARGPR